MGASISGQQGGNVDSPTDKSLYPLNYNTGLTSLAHIFQILEPSSLSDVVESLPALPMTSEFTFIVKTTVSTSSVTTRFKTGMLGEYLIISTTMLENGGNVATFTNPNGAHVKPLTLSLAPMETADLFLIDGVLSAAKCFGSVYSLNRVFNQLNLTPTIILGALPRPGVNTMIRDSNNYVVYARSSVLMEVLTHLLVMIDRGSAMTIYNTYSMDADDQKRLVEHIKFLCASKRVSYKCEGVISVINLENPTGSSSNYMFKGKLTTFSDTTGAIYRSREDLKVKNDATCGLTGRFVLGTLSEQVVEYYGTSELIWNNSVTDDIIYAAIPYNYRRCMIAAANTNSFGDRRFVFRGMFALSTDLERVLARNNLLKIVKVAGKEEFILHNLDGTSAPILVFADRINTFSFNTPPTKEVDYTFYEGVLHNFDVACKLKRVNLFNTEPVECFTALSTRIRLSNSVDKTCFLVILNPREGLDVALMNRVLKFYNIPGWFIITKENKMWKTYSKGGTMTMTGNEDLATFKISVASGNFVVGVSTKQANAIKGNDVTLFTEPFDNANKVATYSYIGSGDTFAVPSLLFMGSLLVTFKPGATVVEIDNKWSGTLISKPVFTFIKTSDALFANKLVAVAQKFNTDNPSSKFSLVVQGPETMQGASKIGEFNIVGAFCKDSTVEIDPSLETMYVDIEEKRFVVTIKDFKITPKYPTSAVKLNYLSDAELDTYVPMSGWIDDMFNTTPFSNMFSKACTIVYNNDQQKFTMDGPSINSIDFPSIISLASSFKNVQATLNSFTLHDRVNVLYLIRITTEGINILNLHTEIKRILENGNANFDSRLLKSERMVVASTSALAANDRVFTFVTKQPVYIASSASYSPPKGTIVAEMDGSLSNVPTSFEYISRPPLPIHCLTLYPDVALATIKGPVTFFRNTRAFIPLYHPSVREVKYIADLFKNYSYLVTIVCEMESSSYDMSAYTNVFQFNKFILVYGGQASITITAFSKSEYTKFTVTNQVDKYYNTMAIANKAYESTITNQYVKNQIIDFMLVSTQSVYGDDFNDSYKIVCNVRVGKGNDFINFDNLESHVLPKLSRYFVGTPKNQAIFVPDVDHIVNKFPDSPAIVGLTTGYEKISQALLDIMYALTRYPNIVGVFARVYNETTPYHAFHVSNTIVSTNDLVTYKGYVFYGRALTTSIPSEGIHFYGSNLWFKDVNTPTLYTYSLPLGRTERKMTTFSANYGNNLVKFQHFDLEV